NRPDQLVTIIYRWPHRSSAIPGRLHPTAGRQARRLTGRYDLVEAPHPVLGADWPLVIPSAVRARPRRDPARNLPPATGRFFGPSDCPGRRRGLRMTREGHAPAFALPHRTPKTTHVTRGIRPECDPGR